MYFWHFIFFNKIMSFEDFFVDCSMMTLLLRSFIFELHVFCTK